MKRTANSTDLYFVTLTVVDWIDVFTRLCYKDFLVSNLNYCQKVKALEIYAYVIMSNHLHMIAGSAAMPLSDILRDFKTFTSKELIKMIQKEPTESRRNWMLSLFEKHGKENQLNINVQFWQNGNHPTLLFSNEAIQQKTDYIHNNPVRAGIVDAPEHYLYSSAHPLSPLKVLNF